MSSISLIAKCNTFQFLCWVCTALYLWVNAISAQSLCANSILLLGCNLFSLPDVMMVQVHIHCHRHCHTFHVPLSIKMGTQTNMQLCQTINYYMPPLFTHLLPACNYSHPVSVGCLSRPPEDFVSQARYTEMVSSSGLVDSKIVTIYLPMGFSGVRKRSLLPLVVRWLRAIQKLIPPSGRNPLRQSVTSVPHSVSVACKREIIFPSD